MELSLRIKKYGIRGRGLARKYFGRPLHDGHLADHYHNPDNDDDDDDDYDDYDDDDNDNNNNNNNVISMLIIPPTKRKFWNREVCT
jgi:hypothetical protein